MLLPPSWLKKQANEARWPHRQASWTITSLNQQDYPGRTGFPPTTHSARTDNHNGKKPHRSASPGVTRVRRGRIEELETEEAMLQSLKTQTNDPRRCRMTDQEQDFLNRLLRRAAAFYEKALKPPLLRELTTSECVFQEGEQGIWTDIKNLYHGIKPQPPGYCRHSDRRK